MNWKNCQLVNERVPLQALHHVRLQRNHKSGSAPYRSYSIEPDNNGTAVLAKEISVCLSLSESSTAAVLEETSTASFFAFEEFVSSMESFSSVTGSMFLADFIIIPQPEAMCKFSRFVSIISSAGISCLVERHTMVPTFVLSCFLQQTSWRINLLKLTCEDDLSTLVGMRNHENFIAIVAWGREPFLHLTLTVSLQFPFVLEQMQMHILGCGIPYSYSLFPIFL